MPLHNAVERALQRRQVQRPSQPKSGTVDVSRALLLILVQKPEPSLRERERRLRSARIAGDRGFARPLVRVYPRRQSLDGRVLEQVQQRRRRARRFRHARQQLRRQQRIPAGVQEPVPHSCALAAQHLAPQASHQFLGGRPRREVFSLDALSLARTIQPQPRSQADALRFPRRPFRDLVQEDDPARHLKIREAARRESPQLAFDRSRAGFQNHRGGHVLAQPGVWDGEGQRLRDRRMLQQRFVDFAGRDLLPAAIYDLLGPPADEEVAFLVEPSLVARAEPASAERAPVCFRVARIACRHVRPANDDLTRLARPEQAAALVHDRDLGPGGPTHRARLPFGRRKRIARHLVRRLRHPVGFDHRDREDALQLGHHPRRERRRARANEAQGRPPRFPARPRQNRLVHGRDRGIPSGLELIQPFEETRRVEPGSAHHARARGQRREQGGRQAVDVEQRHHVQAPVRRREFERARDVPRRVAQVGVRQRHLLGPRRCARGVQHQRHIPVLGRLERPLHATLDAERARRFLLERIQIEDVDPARLRRGDRRRHRSALDDQCPGLEIGKVEIELRLAVSRVERSAHRARRDGKERRRHLRSIRQYDGDPAAAPDSPRLERGPRPVDLRKQPGVTQGRAARRQQRRRIRSRCRPSLEQPADGTGIGGHEVL